LPKGFNDVRADLVKHYNEDVAEQIFNGNALRLLSYWGAANESVVAGGS